MIKAAMISLGCSKNLVDAETMLGAIQQRGWQTEEDPSKADVIVVNTCGFIEDAQRESIDTVLEMAEYKKTGRCRALIVTGCMAQMFREQVKRELPEVDAVLGTGSYEKICEAIENALEGRFYDSFMPIDRGVMHGDARIVTTPFYTAFLKIAEGCSNRCAYCAIPMIRGPFRSRPMEDIVREVEGLAKSGVKELIVIAQDTTRYGEDIYKRPSLAELLKRLCAVGGIEWIRVHYCYPERIDDELIETFAQEKKLLHYFDIPVQHCSDKILKAMRRRGDGALVRSVIKRIRERMPDAVIRTTLLVGFPGEDDGDFEELCAFVDEMRFERLGVFAFSPQEGTPACTMDGQVDEETKKRRAELIMQKQNIISAEFARSQVGRELDILCEGADENGVYFGRSYMDSPDVDPRVYFTSERGVGAGETVRCRVTGCDEYDLFAREEEQAR